MKTVFTISAAAVAFAALTSMASAQETPESAVVGQSGNPAYPLEVLGANGITYDCREDTVVANGRIERRCIRRGGAATTGGGLTGLEGPGILAGIAAIVLLTGGLDSSSGTD